MFKRNLTLALRVFLKNPLSSFITIGGLSLGISCFLLLFVYLYNEYTTDRFHSNYDDIFHVTMKYYAEGEPMFSIPPPAGMYYDLPSLSDIDLGTRVFSPRDVVVKNNDEAYLENGLIMVDSAWLSIFNFKYLNSNFDLFKDAKKVIITSAKAQSLFGSIHVLDKEVSIDGELYTIENVMLTDGLNSSMNINFILPFNTRVKSGIDVNSYSDGHTPYFVLSQALTKDQVAEKLQKLIAAHTEKEFDVRIETTSLKDFYFNGSSSLKLANGDLRGNKKYYHIFMAIGLLILSMAIINYVNLITARAAMRAKEVGIKKTIGAQKKGLWIQFISESLLVTIVAGILAVGLTELALTYFNSLLIRPVSSDFFMEWQFLLMYILSLIIISLVAGIYPAFVLSSFKPIGALNAAVTTGKSWLRNALVTLQFAITTLLIFGALVIFSQVSFLSTIDLGFDKDQIISIKASDEMKKHIQVIKNDLIDISGIESVSVGNLPGIGMMYSGNINGQQTNVAIQNVDEDFQLMAGLELLEGRFLTSEDEGTNNTVINKKFRDLIFGDSTTVFGALPATERHIIGVVDDFQFSSLKNEVMPLELKVGVNFRDILIRVKEGTDPQETISLIKSIIYNHAPDAAFEFSFLDEDYNNQFKSEQLFLSLLRAFTLLSVIIGGLGLFGLAQFNFIKSSKVISIKKILGAPQLSVVIDLIKNIVSPILLGLIVALPIGYYLMSDWLGGYTQKITIDWKLFLVTVSLVFIITVITVLYQILNTLSLKPIELLKED